MAATTSPLEKVVRELPPDLRDQAREFAEFLLSKRGHPPGRALRQGWAGAFRDLRKDEISLELQRRALQW